MLENLENFDTDLNLLLKEFFDIQESFNLLKKGFLNDEDKNDLEDIAPYLETDFLEDVLDVIDNNLGEELNNLYFHAKKLTRIKKTLNDESKLNIIKTKLTSFYSKYFNFYFSLYGMDKSWAEINKFYLDKVLITNSLRKRLIPKIVSNDDGLVIISGSSLESDIVIKPEENKDYLDCKPDFDYWVKNIFRILDREKQWGHTNDAYEIAKQIRDGKIKDFDPTLLKANICYWNNYCEEIKGSLKEYLRKEDQLKWNEMCEQFFKNYSTVKKSFMENISFIINKDRNEIDADYEDENDYLEEYEQEDQTGFVYLIRNQDIYKIGITQNLLKRMNQLKADELLDSVRCSNYKELEKEIHQQFKEYRIPQSEYFRLNSKQIASIHKIFRSQ